MLEFFPDTNVLIDFGRDAATRNKLQGAVQRGTGLTVAPPALIELVRGMVAHGRDMFAVNKRVFAWLHASHFRILELPRPFMARMLGSSIPKSSGVEPGHYVELIEMIASSESFDDFLRRSEGTGSVWKDISRADQIHRSELDREFKSFELLAKQRSGPALAQRLSRLFGAPGRRPKPFLIERKFSAAIEFLESSLSKVRGGAKPRKNDPGLYTDFQLLLYLASENLNFLTCEDFSSEIRRSPQKARIVHPNSLP